MTAHWVVLNRDGKTTPTAALNVTQGNTDVELPRAG